MPKYDILVRNKLSDEISVATSAGVKVQGLNKVNGSYPLAARDRVGEFFTQPKPNHIAAQCGWLTLPQTLMMGNVQISFLDELEVRTPINKPDWLGQGILVYVDQPIWDDPSSTDFKLVNTSNQEMEVVLEDETVYRVKPLTKVYQNIAPCFYSNEYTPIPNNGMYSKRCSFDISRGLYLTGDDLDTLQGKALLEKMAQLLIVKIDGVEFNLLQLLDPADALRHNLPVPTQPHSSITLTRDWTELRFEATQIGQRHVIELASRYLLPGSFLPEPFGGRPIHFTRNWGDGGWFVVGHLRSSFINGVLALAQNIGEVDSQATDIGVRFLSQNEANGWSIESGSPRMILDADSQSLSFDEDNNAIVDVEFKATRDVDFDSGVLIGFSLANDIRWQDVTPETVLGDVKYIEDGEVVQEGPFTFANIASGGVASELGDGDYLIPVVIYRDASTTTPKTLKVVFTVDQDGPLAYYTPSTKSIEVTFSRLADPVVITCDGATDTTNCMSLDGTWDVEINGQIVQTDLDSEAVKQYFATHADFSVEECAAAISCAGATNNVMLTSDSDGLAFGSVTAIEINGVNYPRLEPQNYPLMMSFGIPSNLLEVVGYGGAGDGDNGLPKLNFSNPSNADIRVRLFGYSGGVDETSDNPTIIDDQENQVISFCLASANFISCVGATNQMGFDFLGDGWEVWVDGVHYPSEFNAAVTVRQEFEGRINTSDDGFATFENVDNVPHRIMLVPRAPDGDAEPDTSYTVELNNANTSFMELEDGSLVWCLAPQGISCDGATNIAVYQSEAVFNRFEINGVERTIGENEDIATVLMNEFSIDFERGNSATGYAQGFSNRANVDQRVKVFGVGGGFNLEALLTDSNPTLGYEDLGPDDSYIYFCLSAYDGSISCVGADESVALAMTIDPNEAGYDLTVDGEVIGTDLSLVQLTQALTDLGFAVDFYSQML